MARPAGFSQLALGGGFGIALMLAACGGALGVNALPSAGDDLAYALSLSYPGDPNGSPDDPNGHHGGAPVPTDPNGAGDPNGVPGGDPGDSDARAATCARVEKLLERDRGVLEATPEWQAVTQTDAWATFSNDIEAFKAAGCAPFERAPSSECSGLSKQMRDDFRALEHTDAYRALEATLEYQLLHEDYAAMRRHGCWQTDTAADPNAGSGW